MNTIKYIIYGFLLSSYVYAVDVTFEITKKSANDYELKITPHQLLSENLKSQWPLNQLIQENTINLSYGTIELLLASKKDKYKKRINLLKKLASDIRTHIINNMWAEEGRMGYQSTINLTVDLAPLTTFNKAYRELYNLVRTFSKDITRKQLPDSSYQTMMKRWFGWEKKEDEFEYPESILPDLAPQAWGYERALQSHPKITGAAAIIGLSGLIGPHILSRLKSSQQ